MDNSPKSTTEQKQAYDNSLEWDIAIQKKGTDIRWKVGARISDGDPSSKLFIGAPLSLFPVWQEDQIDAEAYQQLQLSKQCFIAILQEIEAKIALYKERCGL